MPDTFRDLNAAARTREAMRKIAIHVVEELYPRPRHATVLAVDLPNQRAQLEFPDEVGNPFWVKATVIMPQVGATVRVAGRSGARYIDEVQSGGIQINGSLGIWEALPLQGVFANYNATSWAHARVERVGNRVNIEGMIQETSGAGIVGKTLAVLPVGYRPTRNHTFMQPGLRGTNYVIWAIDVLSSGNVNVSAMQAGTDGSCTYLSLDGITFDATN